jgi:hypothetical protein
VQQRTAGAGAGAAESSVRTLRLFVFALFFMFGGITSLNDVIVPKLKALFTLNYAQAMLVNFAFFIAYFLISIPGAAIVARIGYMRTAALGLMTMTVGCLLFIPASSAGLFIAFLGAIFVLGAGITIVQVVSNPLISMLGRPQTAHSRLTDDFSLRRIDPDPRVSLPGRPDQARGSGARTVSHAGDPGHCPHLHRPCDGADPGRSQRLDRPQQAGGDSERNADSAALSESPEAPAIQLRGLMHLCLCGR